ncbi:MAG: nucleoside triphosphate pyrophosphohydrolase [Thermodesulfobacteriota bacterium]
MDRTRLSGALVALYELVARLRGPGGCPWDARQTPHTVKMYLLEECYEVLDALERDRPRQVCQELGDLLFQVLFLAYMGEEKGEFDLLETLEGIHEKMVRRHPHVFGREKADSPEEVARNWARIKEDERSDVEDPGSLLRSVPAGLPALLRAHRLSERASKASETVEEEPDPWAGTQADFKALEGALAQKDTVRSGEILGRLLFDLASLARSLGFNAEDLLRKANQAFVEGFRARET